MLPIESPDCLGNSAGAEGDAARRAITKTLSTPRRLVSEIRRQPSFDLLDRLSLSFGIRRDLILAESADGEIPGPRMREVQSAHAGCRGHRSVLGQGDADLGRVEQVEQLEFLAVVGARGVTE